MATIPLNPLREIVVGCPICGEASSHLRLKPRLYAERERDIDMRTTLYWWSSNELSVYHPPLYSVWQCPQCYFAAENKFFEEPAENFAPGLKKMKETLLSAMGKNLKLYKVVATLSRAKKSDQINFYEAIRLQLIAIFQLVAIGDAANGEQLTIARYCLHLGWLYCDLLERPKEATSTTKELLEVVEPLKECWPEIPLDYRQAYTLAIKYYTQAFTNSYAIERAIDQVDLQLLVARLHLKLGDVPNAQQQIAHSRESTRRFETAKQKERRLLLEMDKDFTDKETFDISATLRRMRLQTEQVQIIFEQIRDKYDAEESSRAEKLISKLNDETTEQLRQKLIAAGIREIIAIKVVQAHENKKSKKGMLDLFR